MRRITARQNSEIVAKAAIAPEREAWASWLSILGMTLLLTTLLLLMTDTVAHAEPGADPGVVVSAALLAVVVDVPAAMALADPMDELLVVPYEALFPSEAELADESIAAAVALGTNPDLIPRSKFRKRSMDLFRTERKVEINQREMLVRLRLRAKARRAMSVEVRF